MSNKLIPMMDVMHAGKLADEFMAIAYTIEGSLIDAGAVPGEDYKILDLYKLAQPFVLEKVKNKEIDSAIIFPTKELMHT